MSPILTDQEFDLLSCNLNEFNMFDRAEVEKDIERYYKNTENWDDVYGHVSDLAGWAHSDYVFPKMHVHHDNIVRTVALVGAKDVCEVGAGAGSVSKYVYASTGANMTCLEGSDIHIGQMKENFSKDSNIIPPQIDVPANIVKGYVQNSPIADNSFDLVYTCTVMMHVPFLVVPRAALQIKRMTRKYILHVENRNDVINCVHIPGEKKNRLNYLCIDYRRLYESIGVKTVRYEEYRDPHSESTYVYYLGEKMQ